MARSYVPLGRLSSGFFCRGAPAWAPWEDGGSAVAEALLQRVVGLAEVEAVGEPQLPLIRPPAVAAAAIDDLVGLRPRDNQVGAALGGQQPHVARTDAGYRQVGD